MYVEDFKKFHINVLSSQNQLYIYLQLLYSELFPNEQIFVNFLNTLIIILSGFFEELD